MELKNAVAICLISLFSATLVLLIARALDLQAASRLEPQLARIVEELQAIRKAGGMAGISGGSAEGQAVDDGLVVYYFHSNTRCPTCRAIESQSHETVQSDFASQLDDGQVVWKILNYEEPTGVELARKFEIQMPVVVLAKINGGQMEEWKRLDEVWALVGDKPAFAQYIRDEINGMLKTTDEQTPAAPNGDAPAIPVSSGDPSEIPVPTDPADMPLPE